MILQTAKYEAQTAKDIFSVCGCDWKPQRTNTVFGEMQRGRFLSISFPNFSFYSNQSISLKKTKRVSITHH